MRRSIAAAIAAAALFSGLMYPGPRALAQDVPLAPDASPDGVWLAGDLHVHTTYSHDSYGGPHDDNTDPLEDPPDSFADLITAGHPVTSQFAVAATRGLDYLAITDHNDVRSQADPGWSQAPDLGVIPVPGYENSLRKGHAQMIGATKLYDNGDRSAPVVNAIADQLRADDGVFQINHPTDDDGRFPDNLGWGYGYDVVPDTIEVWNITRGWQKPMPSSNSADDATRYWEQWLDDGYRVGVTGGSDTHWLTTTAVQGVGQPTTWVYATEATTKGVIEGLRLGRTFISHQPPAYGGAEIYLEADANRDRGYESMVGDTVPAGVPLRARVVGAPGSLLGVFTDGGAEAFPPIPVTGPDFTHDFTLDSATWVRAEAFEPDAREQRRDLCDQPLGDDTTYCRNQIGVLAMTSALYISDESPTLLTLDGPASGRYSDATAAVATLTGASGTPLGGENIELSFTTASGSRSFLATTGTDGRATFAFELTEAPGPAELTARFAGSDGQFGPSSASMGFVIEKEITGISLTEDGRGSNATLTAVLTDDETVAIADRAIVFTADGQPICTEPVPVTDAQGRATCQIPPRYRGANHDFRASFDGDDYYLPTPPAV